MLLLLLGLALFVAAHLFKRIAPDMRASMGDPGKGVIALVLLASVVLMVIGYRHAPVIPLYSPPPGLRHLNNLAMLVAIFLFGVGGTKGTLYPLMRHPMLWGTVIWAVSHLAVRGDLSSLILFGGIGLWALLEMQLINRAGPWARPLAARGFKGDLMNAAGTLVLYGVIAYVHIWLGYNPFTGGTG